MSYGLLNKRFPYTKNISNAMIVGHPATESLITKCSQKIMRTKNKKDNIQICIIPEGSLCDPNNFVSNIRLVEPLNVLQRKGGLKWFDGTKVELENIERFADIIIIQRTPFANRSEINKWADKITKLKRLGKTFIYEIDDYIYDPNLPNLINNGIDIIDEEAVELTRHHNHLLNLADYISVSTKELGKAIRNHDKNIVVFPNYLELQSPKRKVQKNYLNTNKRITLGWCGGSRVGRDLEILPDILENIFSRYNNVDFLLGGSLKYKELFKTFPTNRILLQNWVPYLRYTSQLSYIDIGLIPMEENSYNRCKSPLKAIDFGAMSIPVIASNVIPFEDFLEHGKTGYLASNFKDWVDFIDMLLECPGIRKKIGGNSQKNCFDNYNLVNNINKRMNFYRNICQMV